MKVEHDTMRTRIKVCCIQNPDEAALAIRFGADALGLVAPMPSGVGNIDDQTAQAIARVVPPPVSTFLLTAEVEAAAIADHVRRVGADTVQIVDHIDPAQSEALANMIPDIRRVQAIHVLGPETLELIPVYAPHNHALLLDSGKPHAKHRTLGGTGQIHDWSISRTIVQQTDRPVFLAGGLHADNVGEAIQTVRPYGVDLCSKIRTDGALDADKLRRFVHAVRNTDTL